VPYRFLGDSPRTYPQYLNADTGCTLRAEPGLVYAMAPATGIHALPVPPGDGLWGPEITWKDALAAATEDAGQAAEASAEPPDETSTEQDPPPAKTASKSKAAAAAEGA
jgi:hypothetical protein